MQYDRDNDYTGAKRAVKLKVGQMKGEYTPSFTPDFLHLPRNKEQGMIYAKAAAARANEEMQELVEAAGQDTDPIADTADIVNEVADVLYYVRHLLATRGLTLSDALMLAPLKWKAANATPRDKPNEKVILRTAVLDLLTKKLNSTY